MTSSAEALVMFKEADSMRRKQHKRTTIITVLLSDMMCIDCLLKNRSGQRENVWAKSTAKWRNLITKINRNRTLFILFYHPPATISLYQFLARKDGTRSRGKRCLAKEAWRWLGLTMDSWWKILPQWVMSKLLGIAVTPLAFWYKSPESIN